MTYNYSERQQILETYYTEYYGKFKFFRVDSRRNKSNKEWYERNQRKLNTKIKDDIKTNRYL